MAANWFNVALPTVIECTGLYLWLRGILGLGLVFLVGSEVLESGLLFAYLYRQSVALHGPAQTETALTHFRKLLMVLGATVPAEILVWLAWLSLANRFGTVLAAAALLIMMHLKHRTETSSIGDEQWWIGLLRPTELLASLAETLGAVFCLWLLQSGQVLLAAASLVAGIGIEHSVLVSMLATEISRRDIRVPKSRECQ